MLQLAVLCSATAFWGVQRFPVVAVPPLYPQEWRGLGRGGLGGGGGTGGGAAPGSVCLCQCVCPSLLHCLLPLLPLPPLPLHESPQPPALRVVATSSDRNFMNKHQKPVLTGQRFKTRKRDEKEKFEPTVFRDTLVQGLNEAGDDLEAVAKFLDSTGSRLDYRRYADTLFDILVAGSMLAPGGTRIDDGDKTKMTNHCVFSANEDHETIRNYAQVFNKLIRRYKYLEKAFEDEMKKLLLFLKAFSETEQTKLAMLSGILLGNGTLPATILTSLFTDSLVKEGIAASFAVKLFKAWMAEKDANSVTSSLRKANLDKRLLELFPVNRQSVDHFAKYFTDAGLKELSDFLRVQQSLGTRKELQKELQERLSQECPIKEVVLYVKEEMKRNDLPETAVIGLLWTSDVLSEEAILKWYKEAHVAKGKSVFLDQMKKFVEWLQNAEEESESEGEEN
ncbi:PREDICTED: basic leucine zipper and W2 domain-containing protein 2 [Mandrillus leucophaeus]|uniref:basic leucine zipper and W2 domain-containing protein 2 n=1 Tax=Mandrillus leucophaeus TaxID=9568 RepID=UPI0005F473DF|nr:PREDICTED: basic leucine zipper and W2 domain-containing protein 2 [Mandrillus leucophaeus]